MGGSCGVPPWRRAGFRSLAAGKGFDDAHRAAASGAFPVQALLVGIGTPVFAGRLIRLSLRVDQTSDLLDPVAADTIGQEACVPDPVEAGRQDMGEEPADELGRGQAHDLHPVPALDPVVLPPESHGAGIRADEAVVRDRDGVGVSAEIGQDRLRAAEWGLGVDDPVDLAQRREMGLEGVGIGHLRQIAEERQLACFVQPDQSFDEQTPIEPRQDLHRQKEPRAAGDPSGAIRRQPATWHDDMGVRVMGHRRAPCVQHAGHADPGPEMLRIGRVAQINCNSERAQPETDFRRCVQSLASVF